MVHNLGPRAEPCACPRPSTGSIRAISKSRRRPAWIHTDVKAEVIRNASLDAALSVLDDNLTVNIAQAFALHPWVAKVTRVSKHHPARVKVEVVIGSRWRWWK